jgi:hypothetical protein
MITVLFFTVAIGGAAARRWRVARTVALVVLLATVVFYGLTGRSCWPFFAWHLYGYRATTNLSFNQMRVVDGAGLEIPYDARAIAPSRHRAIAHVAASPLRPAFARDAAE